MRGRALRRLGQGWLALAPFVLSGCYTYVPLRTTASPEPGDRIQIELNDAGRVGMTDAIGPEVGKVEGTLESASDSEVVLRVGQVWGEYGGVSRWEGERVAFKQAYIRSLNERRFSALRTAIVATLVSGGIVAFIATRSLLGIGTEPGQTGGSGGTGTQ